MLQKSLDEVDPKLLETFSKLGIPISEQKRLAGVKDVAYDYVFDSESIATTFKKELAAQGIIFCSIFRGCQGVSRPGEEAPGQRGESSKRPRCMASNHSVGLPPPPEYVQ